MFNDIQDDILHFTTLLGEGRVHQVDDHALVYHCNLHWTGATTVELDIT